MPTTSIYAINTITSTESISTSSQVMKNSTEYDSTPKHVDNNPPSVKTTFSFDVKMQSTIFMHVDEWKRNLDQIYIKYSWW